MGRVQLETESYFDEEKHSKSEPGEACTCPTRQSGSAKSRSRLAQLGEESGSRHNRNGERLGHTDFCEGPAVLLLHGGQTARDVRISLRHIVAGCAEASGRDGEEPPACEAVWGGRLKTRGTAGTAARGGKTERQTDHAGDGGEARNPLKWLGSAVLHSFHRGVESQEKKFPGDLTYSGCLVRLQMARCSLKVPRRAGDSQSGLK